MFMKNIVLLISFTTECRLVFGEDCAFAEKAVIHAPSEINARRKLPFGITYPVGFFPSQSTGQNPPTLTDPKFTARKLVTKDKYPWRSAAATKTPPTLFFPKGSRSVTVTNFPFPLMSVDPINKEKPCELYTRHCMKAYDTGYICGRALQDIYFTFNNYCTLNIANCNSKTTIWQVAYFGSCKMARLPVLEEEFNIDGENFLEAAVINAPPFDPMIGKQEAWKK